MTLVMESVFQLILSVKHNNILQRYSSVHTQHETSVHDTHTHTHTCDLVHLMI